MLDNPLRVRLAWSLIFALPGPPVIYYGDEIGMGEDLSAEGRAAVRTPMQWTKGRTGGFSNAAVSALVQKPVSTNGYDPGEVNVEAQQQDPDSLFHWLKTLIRQRRLHADLIRGRLDWLESGAPEVLAQSYRADGRTLLILHNLSGRVIKMDPGLAAGAPDEAIDLVSEAMIDLTGRSTLTLPPYGCRWLLWETTT